MLEEGFFFFIFFNPFKIFSSSPNKKRKDDQNDIAFLLSLNLRDYPLTSSGFVPFGVPICNRDLSRIELSYSPFA
jgi:hypothetical protein